MDTSSLKYTELSYGDHVLQRVGVWELPEPSSNEDGYWVVYIHGGAWRDPRKLLQGFTPSIRALLRSGPGSTPQPSIRGFASIDYRLSPHPEFPQDPSITPTRSLRNARHPDHILDVRRALALLQQKHDFGQRYILIGHSAGATLAFQLLMGDAALGGQAAPEKVVLPLAFIGVAGIYELVGLDDRHGGNYASFISAAFGDDRSRWNDSMPARFQGSFKDALGASKVLLAWSTEDTLVDEPEIEGMTEKLQRDGVQFEVIKTLRGDHDFVWEDGLQVVQLVKRALKTLQACET